MPYGVNALKLKYLLKKEKRIIRRQKDSAASLLTGKVPKRVAALRGGH